MFHQMMVIRDKQRPFDQSFEKRRKLAREYFDLA